MSYDINSERSLFSTHTFVGLIRPFLSPFFRGPPAFAVLSFGLELPEIFRSAFGDLLAPFLTQLNRSRVLLPRHGEPAQGFGLRGQNTVLWWQAVNCRDSHGLQISR
jgi:hypothetical protein